MTTIAHEPAFSIAPSFAYAYLRNCFSAESNPLMIASFGFKGK